MNDQIITKDTTVLNLGCGYNDDGRLLCNEGVDASGWDPHFTPHAPLQAADVVLLNFVINTIEHPPERATLILISYALSRRAFVAAVRTDNRGWKGKTSTYGDGVVTERDTFQKIYIHREFCKVLAGILKKPVHGVKSGIAYVFRDSAAEDAYLARNLGRRRNIWHP